MCLQKCPLAGISPHHGLQKEGAECLFQDSAKSQRAELERYYRKKTDTEEQINSYLYLSALSASVCVFLNVRLVVPCLLCERDERGTPPPFIRPEPIIMTSPQGSIHFNYHPLSNVCVRKPGKHFCMLGKVTDRSRDLSGNGDILCDSL